MTDETRQSPSQTVSHAPGRQWIIDLVREQYDKAPDHYRMGDTWDDGAPAIADAILAQLPLLAAELINTPETADFLKGVPLEAAHQRTRWGVDQDAGKAPLDWFWLIGYLAQKAATAQIAGDVEKAKHHTISTAAALSNWRLHLTGADTRMRPGIDAEQLTGSCPSCDGTGEFQGGRPTLQKPKCQACNGTGQLSNSHRPESD